MRTVSDIEIKKGINEKIGLLEENLRNQITQLESKKRC